MNAHIKAIEAAHAAIFQAPHNQAVKRFFEIRGLARKGKIGDCMMIASHKNALKSIA